MAASQLVIAIAILLNAVTISPAMDLESKLRRPVGIALSENGKSVFTANRDSGTISVIDVATQSVVEEIELQGQLSDIVVFDDRHLLALDFERHQLVLVTLSENRWRVAQRLKIAEYPIRICIDQASNRCFISSLWSQHITSVDLSRLKNGDEKPLRVNKSVRLAFEPRELCLDLHSQNLIVAGSFSNQLAVFDSATLSPVASHRVSGHNIRGMAISNDGRQLFLAQQELHPLARSTRDDVHWGNMVSNLLVSLPLKGVCDPATDVQKERLVYYLGEPGKAAGDPGPIAMGPSGELAVLLSGVNELAISSVDQLEQFQRVSVGRRPNAIVSSSTGVWYVADMFSDSVTRVQSTRAQPHPISLGPQPNLTSAQRGEVLFFDSRLSHDGWMSCHSCHTEAHTSGQLNDNLSDGTFDAPKRVLSLLGVADTGPWAWNGDSKTLDSQVSKSIQDTMHGNNPQQQQVEDLVDFLKTLSPPPALPSVKTSDIDAAIRRGRELFGSLNCQNCHAPPVYTTAQSYDVGLVDAVGNTKFNPPSLRGVGRRQAFFHDASVKSLRDVFVKRKHQLARELTPAEVNSLLQFLRSI